MMNCMILDGVDPFFNLALESVLFDFATSPLLVLWRNDRAVVCGRYQNVYREVDIPSAIKNDIAILRRDSGGGTVYHDLGNINYTIIDPNAHTAIDYKAVMSPVIAALNKLGVPAYMSGVCDIAVSGRKISGSAQRREGKKLMHHGTLLYLSDLDELVKLSVGNCGEFDSKAVESNRSHVTNIAEHIKNPPDVCEFIKMLADTLSDGDLIVPEQSLIEAAKVARDEKYSTWEWIYSRSPAFSKSENHQIFSLKYSAKRGIITDFVIKSDCEFISQNAADLFIGQRLEYYSILKLCTEVTRTEQSAVLLTNSIM